MAYDGLVTAAVVAELREKIILGKIEKVYQPEKDELVFNIHSKTGNYRLFASAGSAHARLHLIEANPVNPPAPLSFCMLLRKHLQGGRITDISQKDSERIVEISLETMNELGFTLSKKLVFEIMGKHSNIILVDMSTGKIIDSIKRVSFDVNRVRQLLPGLIYEYPPQQEKIPFKAVTEDLFGAENLTGKALLRKIGGISPAFADSLAEEEDKWAFFSQASEKAQTGHVSPVIYYAEGEPKEFYILPLEEFEQVCEKESFEAISPCLEAYFGRKESSNQGRQKAYDLTKSVSTALDKMYLKKKRLSEDLLKAEDSEDFRLFGELLTANLHLVKTGMKSVELTNYYDGKSVTVPLDVKASPSKNAQSYFKKYSKAKTAVKEKQIQIEENQREIDYLESVLSYLENTDDVEEIENIRRELVETGYAKRRKQQGGYKEKSYKAKPHSHILPGGKTVLVGRNNKENDILTLKTGAKTDYWFHTKDIPGSHVILQTGGEHPSEEEIMVAASIAAYYSKARTSENVAVDYVPLRYVKKPSGAKPGMVIFTNNRTVWVNPELPAGERP